jgi:tRNA threonylcarbamoyladenosine biosynthesis protein TsaE
MNAHTHSPEETAALGRRLTAQAQAGDVWALVGDLGAGKTHFVQGAASGLGTRAAVTSPTFALLHEYPGGSLPLYHFDFYRLRNAEEALALGLDEYLDGDGLTIIEWADKFPELLPARTLWFAFEITDGDNRVIRQTAAHAP